MTARERIIATRKKMKVTQKGMAKLLHISQWLLDTIESGGVTHPNIVKRIQDMCGLTNRQAEELLPLCRRPHGGSYDPDRYVSLCDLHERKRAI